MYLSNSKLVKKRANSLAEVLMAMAVIAFTIVASMILVVKGWKIVNENEIEDSINGTLIESLEIAKSPSLVKIDRSLTSLAVGSSIYAKLVRNDGNNPSLLEIQTFSLTECNESSPYKITFVSNVEKLNGCLEVKITKRSGYYDIESKIIYFLKDEKIERTLKTFRNDEFEI